MKKQLENTILHTWIQIFFKFNIDITRDVSKINENGCS